MRLVPPAGLEIFSVMTLLNDTSHTCPMIKNLVGLLVLDGEPMQGACILERWMEFLNFKSMYRTEKAFLRFLSVEVAIFTAAVHIFLLHFMFLMIAMMTCVMSFS
jgi:hypothetical protein